jgi:Uri superfamily endonuclease
MTEGRNGIEADFHADVSGLPAMPGAYVLLIQLAESLPVKLVGRPEVELAPGHYLYCGSARGPGGIKARVGRHMAQDKSIRWHVDRLTTKGAVLGAWVFPGGHECELVSMLAGMPIPIAGFGASDCVTCKSHLLEWPSGTVLPFVIWSN